MLDNKVVLVTGSSRGIGKEIALRMAHYGAKVILTYCSNKDEALKVHEQIGQLGSKSILCHLKVDHVDSVISLFKTIDEEFGKLDIVVNNAGVGVPIPMEDLSLEKWNEIVGINLTGPFMCTKYALPLLKKSGDGRIINISSVAGLTGGSFGPHYGATKAGLIGLTKSTARDLAKYGISVNAVAPGPIQSEMTDSLDQSVVEKIINATPHGRMGQMSEVAELVCQLTNPHINYITGQTIIVDGGRYMI